MNTDNELKKINSKYGKIKLNLKKIMTLLGAQIIIICANNECDDKKSRIAEFTSLTTIIPYLAIIIEQDEINKCMKEKDDLVKKLTK